jgi:tRNA dimethylallyltransferase
MTFDGKSPSAGGTAYPPVRDAWYLTGPTASGKSRVGLELAQQLNAEIISLDSMALYRGMDVGTAKPSPADRQLVPHHLLDLVVPNVDFSLSEYVARAHVAMRDIQSRGRSVLFVGGTPLYLKALLRGVDSGPPADWEFRRQIDEELAVHGVAALHQRLELVDPLSAARLHPHDKRRIIRALEVYRLTGQPLSHRQTQFDEGSPAERCKVFVLSWTREKLHQRIDARVEGMFAGEFVAEVQALLSAYGQLSRTAAQAVGYREVIEHLHGRRDLPSTVELVKARTRQFARRQDTWFRSLSECRRIPQDEQSRPAETASAILELGNVSPT